MGGAVIVSGRCFRAQVADDFTLCAWNPSKGSRRTRGLAKYINDTNWWCCLLHLGRASNGAMKFERDDLESGGDEEEAERRGEEQEQDGLGRRRGGGAGAGAAARAERRGEAIYEGRRGGEEQDQGAYNRSERGGEEQEGLGRSRSERVRGDRREERTRRIRGEKQEDREGSRKRRRRSRNSRIGGGLDTPRGDQNGIPEQNLRRGAENRDAPGWVEAHPKDPRESTHNVLLMSLCLS
eukprot:4064154-Pyramimonas_sp.AAC.1